MCKALLIAISLVSGPTSFADSHGLALNEIKGDALITSGHYINPNESESHLYYEALKNQTGVILAVGTYRALNSAGMGQFSHAVLFDIDKNVLEFNRLQVDALKASPSAAHFLAYLTNREDKSLPERFENLLKLFKMNQVMGPDDIDRFMVRNGMLKGEFEYVERVLETLLSDRKKRSFLLNTQAYGRLKRMAETGRILILGGDLAGSQVMRQLADRLSEQKLRIGAMDISNSLVNYIGPEMHRGLFSRSQSSVLQFRINMGYMVDKGVVDKTTQLLMTEREGPGHHGFQSWSYYAVPLTTFISANEPSFQSAKTFRMHLGQMSNWLNDNGRLGAKSKSDCSRLLH